MRAHDLIYRICFLTVLELAVATAPTAFAQAAPANLKDAVEAAWKRSSQARMLEARRDEMLAGRDAAQTWIAGSPSIGISQRSDRWTDQHGVRETEVSLSTPLWMPGQRSARQTLAQTSSEDLEAQIANARLALAGEVRERMWAVAAARETLAEAQDHQSHLEELAGEVMRRVKAGDLARTDGLLAQQEVLAAKAAVFAAQMKAQEALARYQALTGQPDIPVPLPEPVGQERHDPHPRILAARTSLQRSQASLDAVNAIRSDPPTIGIAMRREQDRPANPASHSISVGVQIPIGTAARNRPLETAARTQIETATTEAAMAEASVRTDAVLARQQVQTAEEAWQAASKRATLTREHTRLIDKAFRLGERGLAELIRSQALSHEADVGERQQRIALGLARARLNQALGILP